MIKYSAYYAYYIPFLLMLGLNFYLYRKKAIRYNKNPLNWGLISLPIYYVCFELLFHFANLLFAFVGYGYIFYTEQLSEKEEGPQVMYILLYARQAIAFLITLWLSVRLGDFLIRPNKNQSNADNQQP